MPEAPWLTRKQKATIGAAVVAALLALLTAATAWAQSLHTKVGEVADHQATLIRLEAQAIERDKRLDRLENKIDRILFKLTAELPPIEQPANRLASKPAPDDSEPADPVSALVVWLWETFKPWRVEEIRVPPPDQFKR